MARSQGARWNAPIFSSPCGMSGPWSGALNVTSGRSAKICNCAPLSCSESLPRPWQLSYIADTLPTAVEVTSMAPSATPNRTTVRIYTRCRIDRILFNHHGRRRYNDGPTNHDSLGNDGSRLLDNDWRCSPVLVRPAIAWNLAIAIYRQFGGHCRRGESECTCCTQDRFTHLSCSLVGRCWSPCKEQNAGTRC